MRNILHSPLYSPHSTLHTLLSPLYSLLSTLYSLLLYSLLLTSCSYTANTTNDGDSIEMRYASLLALTQCDGYITAEIKNPWDSTKILHRYIIVDKNTELPTGLPKGDIIRTPLTHAVYYTSVHTSLINQLGAYSSIAGVCDSEYMYLDKLQKDIKAGKIIDCGKGTAPDIEKIIDLSPDAVLLSPFENSGSYGKLGTLGIPLIECADYMETSALGRAEWMRFYGILTGHQAEADTIFAGIEKRYNDLKALVTKQPNNQTTKQPNNQTTNRLRRQEVRQLMVCCRCQLYRWSSLCRCRRRLYLQGRAGFRLCALRPRAGLRPCPAGRHLADKI